MDLSLTNHSSYWKEDAFDMMLDCLDVAVIHLSTDGIVLAFSRGAENLLNWRSNFVMGKDFINLCHETGYSLPFKNIDDIISRPYAGSVISEWFIQSQEKKIWLEWHISPLYRSGNANSILMVGMNITQYKESEERAGKVTAYLHYIINELPHFIFWKDTHSVFLGGNKMFAQSALLESPALIAGKTDYDMPWSKEQSDLYRQDDDEILTTGIPKLAYEEHQDQLDGMQKTMLVSKVPIYDESKHIMGILCIYTDITDRKRMEEELRQAKSQMEVANQIQINFIRNAEHDIRTPLAGLFSLANLATLRTIEPEQKELFADIASCAKVILEYFNDILDFSKTESGEIPLLAKQFDLYELVEKVNKLESVAAMPKKLQFSVIIDENVPQMIISDTYRLQRIMMNLVGNAIKFTHEGFVRLHIKFAMTQDKKPCLIMIVSDSGVGISEENRDFIYEKFSRIDQANKGKYKGIGLGLRVVKQFVNELHGQINFESQLNHGTIFTCIFPVELPLLSTHVTKNKIHFKHWSEGDG